MAEIREVVIERLVYGGDGLAREEGRVMFVPYVLPGERVRVQVARGERGWARATLLEILEPSPARVTPRCPHFGPGRCGGCQWQHLDYEAQLAAKRQIVVEQMERIGKITTPPVRPMIGMDEPWNYRNHVQLRMGDGGLGYVREDRNGIEPIQQCDLMNPPVAALFQRARSEIPPGLTRLALRGSAVTGERLAIVEGAGATLPLPADAGLVARAGRRLTTVRPPDHLTEVVADRRWRVGAGSFFQVNRQQAELLVAQLRALARPLTGSEVLLDLYAGVGLFGLSLAAEVGATYLVESVREAIADGQHNARGMTGVHWIRARAERLMPHWSERYPPPDLLLLDPPRAGCPAPLLRVLGKMAVPTIIYVSCDPATLARDLRRLLDMGYVLDLVQPVDLFPHSYHIESVCRLRLERR